MALTPHRWQEIGQPRLTDDGHVERRFHCPLCRFYAVTLIDEMAARQGKTPPPAPDGFCGLPSLSAPLAFADGGMNLVDLIDADREIVRAGDREVPAASIRHEMLRGRDRWFEVSNAG